MSRLYDRIMRYGTVSTASDGNEPEPWDSAADLRRPIDEPEMVWVEAPARGAASRGAVHKDYRVRPERHGAADDTPRTPNPTEE